MCVCLQCTIIKMSDLNLNDDLLNYELGDDIDDQALYGSDEDELLLSDDELEKDVSKEVKQQLKAEAEQWVKSQIQDKEQQEHNGFQQQQQATTSQHAANMEKTIEAVPAAEVSSTAVMFTGEEAAVVQDNVSTSEKSPQKEQSEFKEPTQSQLTPLQALPYEQDTPQTQTSTSNTDEVTSSSSKEIEMDHSSVISCSTSNFTDTSSFIQSSQDSSSIGMGLGSGDFSDPREDIEEEEREVRTNIKTTNERDIESGSSDQSPEKHHARFMPGKRGGPLLRSHSARGSYHGRPLLRYPPPHGQFPLQQPSHPYAPHTTPHAPAAGSGGVGPQQTQNPNTSIPMHQHDPMNPNHIHRPRHPYPGFRPGGPFGFRHPNPAGMYPQVPHDYNAGNGNTPFNQNFGHMSQPTRAMFRPELPGGPMGAGNASGPGGPGGMPLSMRPGMRFPRPPLQNLPPHGMSTNYLGGPGLRQQQPHPPPQPPLQLAPGTVSTGTGVIAPATVGQSPQLPGAGSNTGGLPPTALRPSKVLINPNFKGGVKAATNKFIKETQFMSTISSHVSHLASDDELLRQQEEFINKNREHIEKRRNERVSPLVSRRTRSRSRTRSHSRERSYTPPNKRGGHFERERDRERERGDRDRERERERGMERGGDRGGSGGAGNRSSRFRRGNSRDRDYEKRGGSGGNYGKRRRSLSPLPSRGGAGSGGSRRVGAGERDRSDAEEDEETRAYRLEIEKQKMLREKILRDKEMKRRRAAEEKLHEEKRTTQSNTNSSNNNNNASDEHIEPQKLKPIIVTERRIISLKRRQQQQQRAGDASNVQQQQTLRKQLPTAKILPEAKRTLTDHLTNAASGITGGGSGGGGGGGSNTAIIKPVLKKETHTHTPTPPPTTLQKHTRRLSTPSDDEVELDYDEDELMLEEEDRLLATPTPSPPTLPASRTPTPEPTPGAKSTIKSNRNSNTNTTKMASVPFSSSNRRVVLKSSSSSGTSASSNSRKELETVATTDTGRSRRSGGSTGGRSSGNGGSSNNANISSSRKGIFDRLDTRRQLQTSHSTSGDGKRSGKGQRIVLKHD